MNSGQQARDLETLRELHERRAREHAAILKVLGKAQEQIDAIADGWTVRAVNPTYAPPPRWLP